MYVSWSSPGAEFLGVDNTISSSCSVKLLYLLFEVCLVVVFLELI